MFDYRKFCVSRCLGILTCLITSGPTLADSFWAIEIAPSTDTTGHMYGAGLYNFGKNPLGGSWFANVKVAAEPEPFYSDLPKDFFDDPILREYRAFSIANFGSYVELSNLDVFAGAGVAIGDGYARLDDPTNILGDEYYVKDPDNDENTINFTGGIILKMFENMRMSVAYDSAPGVYSVGLGWAY